MRKLVKNIGVICTIPNVRKIIFSSKKMDVKKYFWNCCELPKILKLTDLSDFYEVRQGINSVFCTSLQDENDIHSNKKKNI